MPLFRWIDAERIHDALAGLQASVSNLHHKVNKMATLADIKAALDAQSDKLTALAERIAAQANSGAPDPAELQAIADELTAHNTQIDALDVPADNPAPTT